MDKTEYIFYSGGFDTTSYMLECLLIKKIKVQPIIVKVPFIDGKNMRRNSQYHEEVSRQNFYNKFKLDFPNLKNNILDEIIYDEVKLDDDTLELGKIAYKKKIFSREVNQLLYFHQIGNDSDLDIVVGYQKDDNLTNEGVLFLKNNFKFKLPLINDTKTEILEKAQKYNYDKFLYETWSCWYPLPNNKPCGKCALCKITIVDTKLKFPQKTLLI